jgi:hypothetical protein
MDIKALIVEQLEWNGTLKTMRLQPDYRRPLIVAFPDEYAEPRQGPFHFLDSADERRFVEGFADCKIRRLGSSRFRQQGDSTHFSTEWMGIPTQQHSLTLYSLLLPPDAIPDTIHFRDPRSDREFRKTVYRDDEQRRYALYLECRSSFGTFDFVLETEFVHSPERFLKSSYSDSKTHLGHHRQTEYQYVLPGSEMYRVQQFFAEHITMGDSYNAQQAGAMGPNAKASNMSFQQIGTQNLGDVDLARLAAELRDLRAAMKSQSTEIGHDSAIASIGAAEEAADRADGPKVLKHLKQAGRWAFDVATKIGTTVAAKAIENAMGG